jgi:hypothetical protein
MTDELETECDMGDRVLNSALRMVICYFEVLIDGRIIKMDAAKDGIPRDA